MALSGVMCVSGEEWFDEEYNGTTNTRSTIISWYCSSNSPKIDSIRF